MHREDQKPEGQAGGSRGAIPGSAWDFSLPLVPPACPRLATGPQLGTDAGGSARAQGLTGSGGPALAGTGM